MVQPGEKLSLKYGTLTSIPEDICDLQISNIRMHDNMLCEEYNYECISFGNQDQSNCCEGVNDEGEAFLIGQPALKRYL